MKYWVLTLIAVELIITFSRKNMRAFAEDWQPSLLALRTKCIEKESLSTHLYTGDNLGEVFDTMLHQKSDQVSRHSKCFLRCWLKETRSILDNFSINAERYDAVDRYCERDAKVQANSDECEFAFLLLKCERAPYVETP
uniref:Uncharacterized protein n=1 Tax=Glossina morsitans morsitans TaxID=37546 RepID=A0A1B0GFW4_GLOMM